MIAPCQAAVAVHALLHNRPTAVIGYKEAVQIEVEAVLHRRAVDLGDEPACLRQGCPVKPHLRANLFQLGRCPTGMIASPPHTCSPNSPASGFRPRFNAPMTLVVMPEECQSMPMIVPNDWNQKGCASRRSSSSRPYCWMTASQITPPSRTMRSPSQSGTRP